MNFLDAINRILRIQGFIRGDTDALASFSDTAHNSTSQIAQIAVQQEITELSSRSVLDTQRTIQASLTLVTNQRSYDLPTGFIAMWGNPPLFYDTTQNFEIFEYPGGENQLRTTVFTYRTMYGYPIYFYFEAGATQSVSFFPVPDSTVDGRALKYDYNGSVNVSLETDTLPVPTVDQAYALVDMCARRFKFIYEGKVDQPMDADPAYREARSRLYSLMHMKRPATSYGAVYVSGTDNRWL